MKENIIRDKSFTFAIRMGRLYQHIPGDINEFALSKQVLRSGTSVGALIRETEHGESKADFIHKMSIAQKKISGTCYWLELLHATDYIILEQYESLHNDAVEIIKFITAIIKTTKSRSYLKS